MADAPENREPLPEIEESASPTPRAGDEAAPVVSLETLADDLGINLPEEIEPEPQEESVIEPDLPWHLQVLRDRVHELTAAIERYPESPTNYVLRGEALVEAEDWPAATDDFETALDLVEQQAGKVNWGYIHQSLADRARQGLRLCAFEFAGES